MIYLLSLFLISFSFADTSSQWRIGKETRTLLAVKDLGFVSSGCVKECPLKKLVRANSKLVGTLNPVGGQNPAALLCLKIGANVVYMYQKESEDAFCQKNQDIISLSLLLEK